MKFNRKNMKRRKDLFRTTRHSRIPWIPHRFTFPDKNSPTAFAPESIEFFENISPVHGGVSKKLFEKKGREEMQWKKNFRTSNKGSFEEQRWTYFSIEILNSLSLQRMSTCLRKHACRVFILGLFQFSK